MRRRLWYAALVLLIAARLGAQRAQLARKGRQTDSRPPPGFRGHPKTAAPQDTESTGDFPTCPAWQAPLPLSEDRSRPLMRGDISPLSAGQGQGSPHALPRRPGAMMAASPQIRGLKPRPSPIAGRFSRRRRTAVMRTSASTPSTPTRVSSTPTIATPTRATTPSSGASFLRLHRRERDHRGTRRIPVPSVPSSADPGEYGFFGRGEQSLDPAEFPLQLRSVPRQRRLSSPSISNSRSPRSSTSTTPSRARTGCSHIDVRRGTAPHRYHHRHAGDCTSRSACSPDKAYFDFTSACAPASSASPAISAASFSATSSPARASSATSTTTSSNTTWRTSTCWRRTPTAA